MAVPFFDISRQNALLKEKIGAAISGVVDSGRYILGENVTALEKEVAAYVSTKHAIGVASGTDALHLALRAAGVKEGDEVITAPFTFVATAEAIAYCGATPVFVDIEPNTFNLDVSKLAKLINKKTKAILPVHLYGQSCQMDTLLPLAEKHGLSVIEDCAQAMGARFNGRQVGGFGLAGCFSFFPTKNIGCFGDGGMITTNDDSLAAEVRVLRGHGSRTTYHYDIIGYNSRLDELHASILRVKLGIINSLIDKRRHNAAQYAGHLKDIEGIKLPAEMPGALHTYNQYTVRVKGRNGLFEFLKSRGIPAMVYYPLSLHLQKAFASLGYKPGDFPASESAQDEVLSLPIFPELLGQELEQVATAVREYFKR
jgi:dTDP-4-amino-4,6-dideoxygalactose transaminase